MNKWTRFYSHIQKDLKFWVFCFCSSAVYRAAFIFYFRNKIDNASSLPDILWILMIGLRYDAMAATVWTLFPVLVSAGGYFAVERHVDRFRFAWGVLFCFLYAVVCVISKYYFEMFNNQFDHFVINLYYDDTAAIFKTIWSSYHVIRILLVVALIAFASILALRWMLAQVFPTSRARTLIFLFIAVSALAALPVLAEQPRNAFWNDDIISNDDFLNKAILNPFAALYYTITDFKKMNDASGVDTFLPDRNMKEAAQAVFLGKPVSDNLDEYLKKTAMGTRNLPPRHIFLVVMESHDAWPLMNQYAFLHLSDNLRALAQKGIVVRHFLPSGNDSFASLSSIITGLPNSGLSPSAWTGTYPSSVAEAFNRLGYKTNLFYGGELRWQNLTRFAHAQGFTATYGASHMPGNAYANEWGIPDEYLFDFALSKINDAQPSFNLIMTTSNHPPYNVDIYGKGFPLTSIPVSFEKHNHDPENLKILGHYWYADHCLGSFVRKAEKRLKNTLFAVTGDHPGHRVILVDPGFDAQTIPFVLYGKDALKGIHLSRDAAGSHLDIGPTLIELTAPKGFVYYSAGASLLTAGSKHIGIGLNKIVGPDYWLDFSGPAHILSYQDHPLPARLPDITAMKTMYNKMCAIGWWRVKKGPLLQ